MSKETLADKDAKIEALTKELDELKAADENNKAVIQNLSDMNEELKASNQELTTEAKKLTDSNAQLMKDFDSSKGKITELENLLPLLPASDFELASTKFGDLNVVQDRFASAILNNPKADVFLYGSPLIPHKAGDSETVGNFLAVATRSLAEDYLAEQAKQNAVLAGELGK